MNIDIRHARTPPLDQESDEEPAAGWVALQSLDGRAWDSLGGGEHGLVETNTFMHQARYAIALHDAEVNVPRLQGARGCRGSFLRADGAC